MERAWAGQGEQHAAGEGKPGGRKVGGGRAARGLGKLLCS